MSFEAWVANDEQRQAHYEAYCKLWDYGCDEILLELFADIGIVDLLFLKQVGFEVYLTDTHLDLMLQTAPPEFREGQEAITSDYIARYLFDYWRFR